MMRTNMFFAARIHWFQKILYMVYLFYHCTRYVSIIHLVTGSQQTTRSDFKSISTICRNIYLFHYSTKKREYSCSILVAFFLAIYFGSPFGRYPTFYTPISVGRKTFQYAKRMFPLFCAIVKFCSTNRLFTY